MEFNRTTLDGVLLIVPDVHADHRGFFLESYTRDTFAARGIVAAFVQDNHSRSVQKGVLRGLHFQLPPFSQSKLIRATAGAIFDVVVDLRKGSPTFGRWEGFELSAANFLMLFVPAGCAHGFCTLSENSEVQYKVDVPYAPSHDSGIRWNDPDIGIRWPVETPVLSKKDGELGLFREFRSPF
ncbi:MAG: dTDP-4-dehydrorhamnose 3,5-epimerase [Chitinispirillaceae bacterium]|nr:dTDP-4-dehydrorhamnose 3,5-epimerase [Chitinispirillaceae bacterium]